MIAIKHSDWRRSCAQLLTALLVFSGACGHASVISLPLADAATAIDNGPEDGVFDEFSPVNFGAINENGFTSFRTAVDFGLAAIPKGSTINAANLSVVVNNYEGMRQVAVNGNVGGGTVQLNDFSSDQPIGGWTVPPVGVTTLNFDVTGFLSQLVSNNASFAGFNFREAPANTSNFLVMSLDMAGAAPTLSVDFSPPPASGGTFQYAFTNNDASRL
jgi:hypothetical protein